MLIVDNVKVGEGIASAIAQASSNASISRDRGEGGGDAEKIDEMLEAGWCSRRQCCVDGTNAKERRRE